MILFSLCSICPVPSIIRTRDCSSYFSLSNLFTLQHPTLFDGGKRKDWMDLDNIWQNMR